MVDKVIKYSVVLLIFLMPLLNLFYGRLVWTNLFVDTSTRIVMLASLIIFIYLFIKILKNKNKYNRSYFYTLFKTNYLLLFFTLLYFWSFISFNLSSDLYISLNGSFHYGEGFRAYTFYYLIFIFTFLIKDKKIIRLTLELLVAGGAILICFNFVDSLDLVKYVSYRNDLLTFECLNHYGYYTNIITLTCIYLFVTTRNKKFYLLRSLELFLCVNSLMVARSSGPYLGVLVALIALNIIVFIKEKELRTKIILIDLLFVIYSLFLNTSSWNLINDSLKISNDLSLIKDNGFLVNNTTDSIGSGRGVLWREGINLSLKKPLFGFGPDNLYILYKGSLANFRPHNIIIQLAAMLGYPALIFYLTGLGFHLKEFITKFNNLTFDSYGLYLVVLGYLVSSFFGYPTIYVTPIFIIILVYTYNLIRNN